MYGANWRWKIAQNSLYQRSNSLVWRYPQSHTVTQTVNIHDDEDMPSQGVDVTDTPAEDTVTR